MPTLEGTLASIPGLAGALAQRQYNEKESSDELQKMGVLTQLAATLQKRQQEAQLRDTLAQSNGDVESALKAAISSGNIEAAHKLAPLVESARKQKQLDQLKTLDLNGLLDNPQAAMTAATINPHVGPELERLRKLRESSQALSTMREAPQGLPAGSVVPTAPGKAQEVLTPIPPEDRAAFEKVASGSVTSASPQAGDPQVMSGGHPSLVVLMQSKNPAIASQARAMQDSLNRSGNAIPASVWEGRIENLGKLEAAQVQAQSLAEDRRSYAQQGSLDPVKDKEAIRDLAIQSLYDPNALSGFRRDTRVMGHIAKEKIALMREAGITSEDVVSGRAGFKADTISLNKITPQYDAITSFEKTAIRNGKVLVDLAEKVDTTGVPVVERWIRAGRKEVAGDPDVAKFHAQMNLYRAEAARILTQPNLSGVLTDTARREMEDVISNKASASQIREVVGLLEQDFERRKSTLEEQISAIRERMRGRVAPSSEPKPSPDAIPEFATEDEAIKSGRKGKVRINGRNATIQ